MGSGESVDVVWELELLLVVLVVLIIMLGVIVVSGLIKLIQVGLIVNVDWGTVRGVVVGEVLWWLGERKRWLYHRLLLVMVIVKIEIVTG